jgi:hypothetical protein
LQALNLGGHLKTPANERKAGQELLYFTGDLAGNLFSRFWPLTADAGSTWVEDTAPQGCDRSAVQGWNGVGGVSRPAPQAIPARKR